MLLTMYAKWSRGCLDNIALHVVAFVVGPLITTLSVSSYVSATYERWQLGCLFAAGCFYIGGLIPWGIRQLEFHVALWHVCVLVASAAIWVLVYDEVDTPQKVATLEDTLGHCWASYYT